MHNSTDMILKLKRLEICDLLLATTLIVSDSRTEMNDPETSEDRKKILEGTVGKRQTLHDKLKEQLEAQDEELLTENL